MVKNLRQRSGLAWFCACAERCVVFNTWPYTDLPDNSILITANMQSETVFPSSHQLKSWVASKSRLKLAARAVLSADAGLLVELWHIVMSPTGSSLRNLNTSAQLQTFPIQWHQNRLRSPTPSYRNWAHNVAVQKRDEQTDKQTKTFLATPMASEIRASPVLAQW